MPDSRGQGLSPVPTRRRHDLSSLLEVAAAVFTERGYDGTSMEDLSRATGLSKSSLYHHIRSKDQLLRLALERAVARGPIICPGLLPVGADDVPGSGRRDPDQQPDPDLEEAPVGALLESVVASAEGCEVAGAGGSWSPGDGVVEVAAV